MHQRITRASPSLPGSERAPPIKTASTRPDSSHCKRPQTMFGSTVFFWRHGVIFVTIMCLLMVSAISVVSDRSEYSSHDTPNLRFTQYRSSARRTKATLLSSNEPRADMREMAPPKIKNFSEGIESNEASSSVGGTRNEHTMGEMVLDALQSQKQTNTATSGRMLIKEGDMTGKIPGSALESTAEQIASLVEDPSFGEGGYVAQRSSTENEYYSYVSRREGSERKVQRIVKLNLRIPSSHFQPVIQQIKQIVEEISPSAGESSDHKGRITSFSTSGRDVTDEFVDTTARADTLDASRKAIQVLLSRADDIEDVMKIQAKLNQLTQQSESLRRRALDLKNRSELSVLNVMLEEWREEGTPDDGDDIEHDGKQSWSPLDSAYLAWTHVSFALMFAFDTLAYSLVWGIPCMFIYFVFVRVFPKLSRGGERMAHL